MKTCKKCGESKPVSAFSKHKSKKDGLQTQCQVCQKAYRDANKERTAATQAAWYEENKDHHAAYNAAWYAANKDRKAATNAAHYAANKDRKAIHGAAWRKANPRKQAAFSSAWRKANPEKTAAGCHRYRARKVSNGVDLVTAAEIAAIIAQPCTACGALGPSDIDHIIPLARGGAHSIGNLMPLCKSCNSSKQDLLYIEWKHSNRPQAKKVFAA